MPKISIIFTLFIHRHEHPTLPSIISSSSLSPPPLNVITHYPIHTTISLSLYGECARCESETSVCLKLQMSTPLCLLRALLLWSFPPSVIYTRMHPFPPLKYHAVFFYSPTNPFLPFSSLLFSLLSSFTLFLPSFSPVFSPLLSFLPPLLYSSLSSHVPLQGEELEAASKIIGYGAVKYFDLKQHPATNYIFSYDRMLDTKGTF